MTHRDPPAYEDDTETETNSYNSMSSPSRSCEEDMKPREERAKEMDDEMVPYHRFNYMFGEEIEESISPSVPLLEVSSLNTWDDIIRTELNSHANRIVLERHCRLENPDARSSTRYPRKSLCNCNCIQSRS